MTKPRPLDEAEDAGLRGTLPALRRAAKAARLEALRNNSKLVFWRDGKVVHVSPEDLIETEEGLAYRDEIEKQP